MPGSQLAAATSSQLPEVVWALYEKLDIVTKAELGLTRIKLNRYLKLVGVISDHTPLHKPPVLSPSGKWSLPGALDGSS